MMRCKKAIFLFLLFTGCQTIPPYHPPIVQVPFEWKNDHETESDSEELEDEWEEEKVWWSVFNDDELDALIRIALEHNKDVLIAFHVLEATIANAAAVKAEQVPFIDLQNGSYRGTEGFIQILSPLGPPTYQRIKQYTYQTPFVATWKVDLWGKLRNAAIAAKCDAESKNELLRYIKLGISADVAATYFQIRTLDTQLDIYEKTKDIRQAAIEITTARFDAGITNYADVSRAIVEFENVLSEIIEATRERATLENRLAVLIGRNPTEFLFAKGELVPLPEVRPISPCSMIRRRPDIAGAERRLAARFMDIGVTKADLYPDLTITGTLGYFSPDFPELFKWRTRLWNFAFQVSQSLFDAGKRYDRVLQTEEIFYQSVFEFERTMIIAFREVEDALFSIKQRDAQGEALDRSIEASETTFELLTSRYLDGLISYLEVVDAERTLLDTERIRTQVKFFQYFTRIQLMQALGGFVEEE